jgi:hypothetical protein
VGCNKGRQSAVSSPEAHITTAVAARAIAKNVGHFGKIGGIRGVFKSGATEGTEFLRISGFLPCFPWLFFICVNSWSPWRF